MHEPASSRGLAVADFWNDGRLSAVINNMGATPMLLVNWAANKNHWLGIVLKGTKSNRDAIGAKVTVVASDRRQVQELRSGSGYISSSDLRLHFGLGAISSVEQINVRWPSGITENFAAQAADRFITLEEGAGHPDSAK